MGAAVGGFNSTFGSYPSCGMDITTVGGGVKLRNVKTHWGVKGVKGVFFPLRLLHIQGYTPIPYYLLHLYPITHYTTSILLIY